MKLYLIVLAVFGLSVFGVVGLMQAGTTPPAVLPAQLLEPANVVGVTPTALIQPVALTRPRAAGGGCADGNCAAPKAKILPPRDEKGRFTKAPKAAPVEKAADPRTPVRSGIEKAAVGGGKVVKALVGRERRQARRAARR